MSFFRKITMNSALTFTGSPYTSFMHETKVTLSNGIELHVEIGGQPEHPAIMLIMGLGAQLLFWPDFFCLDGDPALGVRAGRMPVMQGFFWAPFVDANRREVVSCGCWWSVIRCPTRAIGRGGTCLPRLMRWCGRWSAYWFCTNYLGLSVWWCLLCQPLRSLLAWAGCTAPCGSTTATDSRPGVGLVQRSCY